MAKWEYCVVTWTAGRISSEQKADLENAGFQGPLVEAEDGVAIAQLGTVEYLGQDGTDQIADLRKFLAVAGKDGWELVQIILMGNGREQFWLKRQI